MEINVSYIEETTNRQYQSSNLLTSDLKMKLKNQDTHLPAKPNMLDLKAGTNKE